MNTIRYGIVVLTAAYAVIGGACVFVPVGTNLRVTITSDRLVNEGMATTLTASAEGGSPPFLFRWSQERGPVDLVLTDIMSDTLVTEPLTTQGDYVFRVVVTDARGDTADTFAPVRVVDPDVPLGEPVVLVDGPATAEFGAGVLLSAQTNLLNAEFAWEVVSGAADIDTPTDDATTVTPTALGTLVVRVTATEVATGREVVGAGRYVDRYRRTAQGWCFSGRRAEIFFMAPLSEGWEKRRFVSSLPVGPQGADPAASGREEG
ncbi:MAG: hypothetical protein ACE5E6_08200 [Phycisphaerae bacterium]